MSVIVRLCAKCSCFVSVCQPCDDWTSCADWTLSSPLTWQHCTNCSPSVTLQSWQISIFVPLRVHHIISWKPPLQLQPPESTMAKVASSHALQRDTALTFHLRLSPRAAPLVNVTDKYWCLARCLSHYPCANLLCMFLAARVLTMVLKSAVAITRLHTV